MTSGSRNGAFHPLAVQAFTGVSCLGRGRDAHAAALLSGRCGLTPNDFGDSGTDVHTCIGRAPDVDAVTLPAEFAAWDCRNHRLAWMALHEDGFAATVARLAQRHGAGRIGVFIGTSTSGMLDTEELFRQRREAELTTQRFDLRHALGSVAEFVARVLQLGGPRHGVSTACSSSAKVFATAARMIAAGACDAAVVGGVDSLCYTTLYGFKSLELLSPRPAQPLARMRSGISIGEAAAFAVLTRDGDAGDAAVELLGTGESSDGYHMSTPHPEGIGAERAMRAALAQARLPFDAIDYINLHGTGTPVNDAVEAAAIERLFGRAVACSSTKGATGHCLGAAGAIEALICHIALEQQFVPANVGTSAVELAFALNVPAAARAQPLRRAISNSFGFGGSNCSLVLGRTDASH